jgi:hypothetical protein
MRVQGVIHVGPDMFVARPQLKQPGKSQKANTAIVWNGSQ